MPHEDRRSIDDLIIDLKAHLKLPGAQSVAFANVVLKRLHGISDLSSQDRINCLLDIVWLFYHDGERIVAAVEPATLAVNCARDCENQPLLRRALSVQGAILAATGNPGGAVAVLGEAMKVAEAISDDPGKIVIWVNLGSAFYEAGLYADATECAARGAHVAGSLEEHRPLKMAALANLGLYCLHQQDYQRGLKSIQEAINLVEQPQSPEQMWARVFAESTYTRLLLATGRISEAAVRSKLARGFAEQVKSLRADISAACSEGLVEVYAGEIGSGLEKGMAALKKARQVRPELSETLLAQIQAHEKAGLQDHALGLHRELTVYLQKVQYDCLISQRESRPEGPSLSDVSVENIAMARRRVGRVLARSGAQRRWYGC